MTNSSDYTLFVIHNNAERYSWVTYHLTVFLSSFIGDSLILYASFHKDAFKINKLIVIVIQHIAVVDILIAISLILPRIISLIANSWVLGDALCSITAHSIGILFPQATCLIAVMTSSKLLVLKFPLRAKSWDKKKTHLICSIFWILSPIYTVFFFMVDIDDVMFNYEIYSCSLVFNDKTWKMMKLILSFIASVAPMLIIIGTTIPTLKYLSVARKSARRVGGNDPWQGALTVALTAILFVISFIPMSVYFIGKPFMKGDLTGPFFFHLRRISTFFTLINVMSNFFIYTLTIKSFRRFLLSKALSVARVFLLTSRNNMTGRKRLFQNSLL